MRDRGASQYGAGHRRLAGELRPSFMGTVGFLSRLRKGPVGTPQLYAYLTHFAGNDAAWPLFV